MVGKDVCEANYLLYTTAFQYNDMEVQSQTNTCIDLSEIFCFQLEFGYQPSARIHMYRRLMFLSLLLAFQIFSLTIQNTNKEERNHINNKHMKDKS